MLNTFMDSPGSPFPPIDVIDNDLTYFSTVKDNRCPIISHSNYYA